MKPRTPSLTLAPWEAAAMAALEAGETMLLSRPIVRQPRIDRKGIHFAWASFYTNGNVHTWDEHGVGGQNWNAAERPGEDKFAEAISRTPHKRVLCKPGDVLLCREKWMVETDGIRQWLRYWAGDSIGHDCSDRITHDVAVAYGSAMGIYWRSAATMPAWAVRLKPVVLSVRAGRIAEMTSTEAQQHRIPEYDAGSHCVDGMSGDVAWYMYWWERKYPRYPWAWTMEVRR